MLHAVSDCAIVVEHDVEAGGRNIKFVLFLRSVFLIRKAAGQKLKEVAATRMTHIWFGVVINVIGKIP